MTKEFKIQNAIELLITYSWVLLLITIMLSVLIIYMYAPKAIIPSTCVIYSGFNCQDTLLTSNTASGLTLTILLNDKQVGIINISSFNAIISNIKSISGSCQSNTGSTNITSGEKITCTASFNSVRSVGTVETGRFVIKGNYCAHQISKVNTGACPNNGNYITNGFIRVQVQK